MGDLRRRRGSKPLLATFVDSTRHLPSSLLTLNRHSRLRGVGTTLPAQSVWHVRAVAAVLFVCNAVLFFLANEARLEGNVTWVVQLALFMIQLDYFMCWRHARTHDNFDNCVKARARTVQLLEDGGREDLARKVDEEIVQAISKSRCLTDNLLVSGLVAPAAWLVLCKGNPARAIAFQVCFAILDHCNNMSCFGWSMLCQLHQLQIQMFHDELSVAFTDLAEATTGEEETRESGRESGTLTRILSSGELLESTEFFSEECVREGAQSPNPLPPLTNLSGGCSR